ncbi:hypothetical protein [Phaffia rhodozyma]|uniref:Uncharacterized protein n=1 Tax=Phaffia rhodozyma TaxID=264483 RepID=A0A0F7SHQ6_PHARH|nr:hypothetical protein [Phaffia rhodozyma]
MHLPPPKILLTVILVLGSICLFYVHSSLRTDIQTQSSLIEKQQARPIKGRFPAWYGNPEIVGASPWDYQVKWNGEEGRKKRVLFLTDYLDYLDRMDTVIYELIDASLRHPGLVVDVWGPQWGEWDNTKTLSDNIHARWGCGYWDVIWTFAHLLKESDPLVDAPGCNTVWVQQLGDCHDGTPENSCMREWMPYLGNVTLSRYAFELTEVFTHQRISKLFPGHTMHLFGHSPDAAKYALLSTATHEWEFYPFNSWKQKSKNAVLFGFGGSFYPLRTTIDDAIREGKTSIQRFSHPGYSISQPQTAYSDRPKTYSVSSEFYKNHIRTREEFAKGMREAQICIFDSSLERKMIRKYAQALLSGCVIAGDLPTEMEDELSEFMVVLQPYWSIEQINQVVAKALANPAELQRKALAGFMFAREHLTNLRKVDKAMELFVGGYERGERGYKFPYGFSMRCRSHWGNDDGFRPSWCEDGSFLGLEEYPMLAYYRSACVAQISGRLTVRIPGRPYTTSSPHNSQGTPETDINKNQTTCGAELGPKKGATNGGGQPKNIIRRSATSLDIAEAKVRAAALTQARVAKAKAKAKARPKVFPKSVEVSSSNRTHQLDTPYGRKIWPGAPKNAVFVKTILPPVESKLIPTDREDPSSNLTTTMKNTKKKGQKNRAARQRATGKWYLITEDDFPTDSSGPSLLLLPSLPPSPPPPQQHSPTEQATGIPEPHPRSLSESKSVLPFSPVWSSPSSPSVTPSTKESSLSSKPSSSVKTTSDSQLSSSSFLDIASESTLADAVALPSTSTSTLVTDTVPLAPSSTASPSTRSTEFRSTLTKAEEYERLWEAEFKNQRSFAIRNPLSIPRSTSKTTPPPLSFSCALSFPPLSEVLSPPSPAHNIFPQLVPSAPGRSPFRTPPAPSVLAREIPSVELLDILVPPSGNFKTSQLNYNRSNPPQIPRRLPTAFRHPAFESFLSEYIQLTPISSLSPAWKKTPSAAALEGKKGGEEDSVRALEDGSIDRRTVVPFNVSDPNWTPSVTQVALLRAATSKKDTFVAVRKPVLSTEEGPISRSKRRARYIARREDERMGKEIQAKVERERLAREEKGLGWSERIRRRLEERERRDAGTNSVFSPPPFRPPPPLPPPQPVPSSAPSGTPKSLSSSSSSD